MLLDTLGGAFKLEKRVRLEVGDWRLGLRLGLGLETEAGAGLGLGLETECCSTTVCTM